MEDSREAIVRATLELIRQGGIAATSLDAVAIRAGCAKGLINYHFGSKVALLEAVAGSLAASRRESRLAAISTAQGAAALDRLWEALLAEVTTGAFGAWVDLHRLTQRGAHPAPTDGGRAGLAAEAARALGLAPGTLIEDELLVAAALEGLQLQLLRGSPPPLVREGFDRFWLALLPE